MQNPVIAFDIGGTKIAGAVVSEKGEILQSNTEMVNTDGGPNAFIDQIASMAQQFKKLYPQVRQVGIASAGPLDPQKGILQNPTNLKTRGQGWGDVPLTEPLKNKLGLEVRLDNDAAAAVLAEHWVGLLKDVDNGVMVTLGTGVGVGAIVNGDLIRSGHFLHPEVGHIPLNAFDKTAPCGCGQYGCIEAYISGKSFTSRCATRWNDPSLTSREIVKRAAEKDPQALEAFEEYAEHFAHAIHIMVVLFCPDKIALSGGFSIATPHFLDNGLKKLHALFERRQSGDYKIPEIAVSKFGNEIGILGAAFVARQT